MRSDRRDFIKTAGAASAGTMVAVAATDQASASSGKEIEAYTRHLDSEFTFSLSSGSWFKARLTEVNALSSGPADHRQPFSLVFTAADSLEVPQDTYAIDHPQLGRQQLLISPVDGVANQTRLEAVFG